LPTKANCFLHILTLRESLQPDCGQLDK